MSLEIRAILRTILYKAMTAESLSEVISLLKVICDKEDIAKVERQIAEDREKKQQ